MKTHDEMQVVSISEGIEETRFHRTGVGEDISGPGRLDLLAEQIGSGSGLSVKEAPHSIVDFLLTGLSRPDDGARSGGCKTRRDQPLEKRASR
jgi:hypothetical protein